MQAQVKIQRNNRSNTIATYFQSSSTCEFWQNIKMKAEVETKKTKESNKTCCIIWSSDCCRISLLAKYSQSSEWRASIKWSIRFLFVRFCAAVYSMSKLKSVFRHYSLNKEEMMCKNHKLRKTKRTQAFHSGQQIYDVDCRENGTVRGSWFLLCAPFYRWKKRRVKNVHIRKRCSRYI